jgi:hypothetical protein
MMFGKTNQSSKLFPTIGFRTINEPSSLEDLPAIGTDKLSNERASYSHAFGQVASVFLKYFCGGAT